VTVTTCAVPCKKRATALEVAEQVVREGADEDPWVYAESNTAGQGKQQSTAAASLGDPDDADVCLILILKLLAVLQTVDQLSQTLLAGYVPPASRL
jgi:hypothetical protein